MKALLFDCDGTLLDTLEDITNAINMALRQAGYDYSFSYPSSKRLIGDGADTLVRRALKDKGEDDLAFEELKRLYRPLYRQFQDVTTHPYEGMREVLLSLKEKGYSLYVLTNKPQALAETVVSSHFGDSLFDGIYGHVDGNPPKPDPFIIRKLMEERSLEKEDMVMIGDSRPDLLIAKNSGIRSVIVKWGYGFYEEEWVKEADYLIDKPEELLKLF